MLNVGTYVKIILKKRNMTQMDLVRKINKLNLGNGKELSRCHLNNFLNGTEKQTVTWARRIEIALNLPKYSLIRMIGKTTELEENKIKEIEKCIN